LVTGQAGAMAAAVPVWRAALALAFATGVTWLLVAT
jgi:hypothetical protein